MIIARQQTNCQYPVISTQVVLNISQLGRHNRHKRVGPAEFSEIIEDSQNNGG